MSKFSFFCILTCCSLCVKAQTGTWNIINYKGTLNNRWSFYTEGQTRTWTFYNRFYYYELKAAVNYNFTKNFSVTGGLGTYHTYTNTGNFKQPITSNEFRTWLQLFITENFGRIYIDHRYRIEQRWLTTGYKNRYRYRLNTIIPLNHRKLDDHTVFATGFDEVFFTNKNPYFERNRVFGGLGYRSNKHFTFQAGYINQFDYNLTKPFGKGYLQLTVFLSGNLKKVKAPHPSTHQSLD
jgi:hypothetical protein